MITINIPLEDWMIKNAPLGGIYPYAIVDNSFAEQIRNQEGWEGGYHLEPIEGEPGTAKNGTLWQLWRVRDWQESQVKREQAQHASEARVTAHEAIKSRLAAARVRLLKSPLLTESKVDFILANLNDFPQIKTKLGL